MEEAVTQIIRHRPPLEVTIGKTDRGLRFTPRELEQIKEHFGRTLSELLDDPAADDKFVVFGWLKLRRDGHTLTLDEMQDVVVALSAEDETPDPTSGAPSATSPPSADSGG